MKKITLLVLFALADTALATTYYVNPGATGDNSGTSWINGFTSLQSAINTVNAGDILYVKAGTYFPDQQMIAGDNRSKAFYIDKNIKLYGGFNGTETTLAERNVNANPTILSGDFNGNDADGNGDGIHDLGMEENAYAVVVAYGLNTSSQMDGFTITGGNANGTASYTLGTYSINTTSGAGINNIGSNLMLKNMRFINNSANFGAGMTNKGACFPTIENCEFLNNIASFGNSVHANDGSQITIANCTFTSNKGSGVLSSLNSSMQKATNCTFTYNQGISGAVSYNFNYCSAVFISCKMSNNTVSNSGGAIYNTTYSITTLYNTLVYKNSAVYGGAVYNVNNSYTNSINCTYFGNNATTKGGAFYCTVSPDNMSMKMYNTIIYGNTAPTYPNWYKEYYTESNIHVKNSIIQGSGGSTGWNTFYGTNEGSNLDVNPIFTSTVSGSEDFRLRAASQGIDAGYNLLLNLPNGNNSWTSTDTDVYGGSRLIGDGVDIGAAENSIILSVSGETANTLSFYIAEGNLIFNNTGEILNKTVMIYDLTGQCVSKSRIINERIPVSQLAKGIYFIKVGDYKTGRFLID